MPDNYGAIPTTYKNIQFRSRLEARTAAFLDLVGLTWDFEPIDLRNTIPDFVVDLPAGPTIIECKPAVLAAEFKAPCRRLTRSGWVGPAIVLGSRLCNDPVDNHSDLMMYGSTHTELGRWARVGRNRWPRAWGEYPFGEQVWTTWAEAGNVVMWMRPT